MPKTNNSKDRVTVGLDEIHLQLIDELMPFFGNSRPEVIRNLIIDWLRKEYGLEKIREKKAIK
jgi:metal-responsive CopG/Arc/MetJ family transcriptional regulator